jgi:mannose-6-phosphate isomerase-like protein (cupin superfamily)
LLNSLNRPNNFYSVFPYMTDLISITDDRGEYFFEEGCYILELSNTAADSDVSIARARVQPGIKTRRHRLHGITERYVILEGNGRVEVGELLAQDVAYGDVIRIPPDTNQCIRNIGDSDLVFLAVCTPRFNRSAYEDTEDNHTAIA